MSTEIKADMTVAMSFDLTYLLTRIKPPRRAPNKPQR